VALGIAFGETVFSMASPYPLHEAAQAGDVRRVRDLLDDATANIDLDARDSV
jgi:hypothetical protein